MKIWQAALLGGMAVMDCLVVVVGGGILIRSIPSASSGSPAAKLAYVPTPSPAVTIGPTLTPSPSETPLTMVFQFPTHTPLGTPNDSPTMTPTPTDLLAEWVKYSVREVEIWMPESYAVGNPHTEADAIIASLKEKGADFDWEDLSHSMAEASENDVLWGFDSFRGNPDIVTVVWIIYDYPNPGEPLADYATRFIGEMSQDFQLIEQRKLAHPLYEIERVLLETKNTVGTQGGILLYAVRSQNVIWDIVCISGAEEMEVRMPNFDRMVDNFRILALPQ